MNIRHHYLSNDNTGWLDDQIKAMFAMRNDIIARSANLVKSSYPDGEIRIGIDGPRTFILCNLRKVMEIKQSTTECGQSGITWRCWVESCEDQL